MGEERQRRSVPSAAKAEGVHLGSCGCRWRCYTGGRCQGQPAAAPRAECPFWCRRRTAAAAAAVGRKRDGLGQTRSAILQEGEDHGGQSLRGIERRGTGLSSHSPQWSPSAFSSATSCPSTVECTDVVQHWRSPNKKRK